MAEIRINTTGGLKLYDADNSHYAQIVAGTITSNVDAITLGHNLATFNAAVTATGILKTDDTTEATSTTDGSLQTDGGLSVAKDTVMGDDLKLLSDASVIHFGANSEITLTHSHDSGLLLKHTATADDKPINLVLQTGETDLAQDDVIGKISFQAPDEGTGTDAILVSAAIQARAEGDFSSSSNATSLDFLTGASEAAAKKLSITSAGHFVPGADNTYDIGTSSLEFKDGYFDGTLHCDVLDLAGTEYTSIASAADDIAAGDAAVTLTTTSGNITVDAQANDSDIIFKGTDNNSDTTFWTMDGSETGNLVPGSTSTGIYLGVNSATASNLLDDYEEGEITNGLDINGTTQTGYSSGRGNIQYVKVGRLVHLQCYLDTDGNTLATTGTLHMRLPFAVSQGSGTAFVTGVNFFAFSIAGTDFPVTTYLNEGDSTISGSHIQSEGDNNSCTIQAAASARSTSNRVIMKMAMSYQTD